MKEQLGLLEESALYLTSIRVFLIKIRLVQLVSESWQVFSLLVYCFLSTQLAREGATAHTFLGILN